MSATNINILINLKNQIFVDEVLTKTKNGGLQWIALDSSTYQVSLCDPPICQVPAPTNNWTLVITKNLSNVSPDAYNYYLEVLLNSFPYLSISSVDVSQVANIYSQIELVQASNNPNLKNVINFLSRIPTDPSTSVSTFYGSGGIKLSGSATSSIAFDATSSSTRQGVFVGGSAPVTVVITFVTL
jgi:hypothetical protein